MTVVARPVSTPLPRGGFARHGVDPAGVDDFIRAAAAAGLELHGLMVFRAGAVVAEAFWRPYAAHRPHMLHSAVKSWTGAAVGLAVGDGVLRLDDRVAGFFPEHLPAEVPANLAAMTVRDLLTMRSGHATGLSGGEWRGTTDSWVARFLREPVPDRPGERFIYSSGSSYMLSAIVGRVTGRTTAALMQERVFGPMGCGTMAWDVSPEGVSTGGNGLSCVLEDVLKFGVLHLQDGSFGGRRLLPAGWVAEATRNHVADVWMAPMAGGRYPARGEAAGVERREGYGYQWWMEKDGAYRASGMFGQQCIVLPRQQAVVAVTAGLRPGGPGVTGLAWEHLVPALGRAGGDATAVALDGLSLPFVEGAAHSALAGEVSGRVFRAEANEDGVKSLRLDFPPGGCRFTLEDGRGAHTVDAGLEAPVEGETGMTGAKLHHAYQPERMRVVAKGAWVDPATFEMTWRFVETAFCDTVTCRFAAGEVRMERRVNTNAGPLERPAIVARA